MIVYKKGNVLDSGADVIAHGVNCSGGFGSGVAGHIAERYPKAREAYLDKLSKEGWKLGDVQPVVFDDIIIYNCATQHAYGYDGKRYVSYAAIDDVMQQLYNYVSLFGMRIAIPKIGAGLGGGYWPTIEEIINNVFHNYEIEVWEL